MAEELSRLWGAGRIAVFIDAVLQKGSWLDMGMFIQNVMLASRGFGSETCPQASLAQYPGIVRQILRLPDSLLLVCGWPSVHRIATTR